MSDKHRLTTKEAADIAGVTDAYIRQLLLEDKKLHGKKFGKVWVIPRAELERWMRTRDRKRS